MKDSYTVQEVDRIIATTLVEELLGHGFQIDVNDGEEFVVVKSTDKDAILAAMFSTDEDYLYVTGGPFGDQLRGWVRLIYGNGGWDVIADHGERLGAYMTKTSALADHFADHANIA